MAQTLEQALDNLVSVDSQIDVVISFDGFDLDNIKTLKAMWNLKDATEVVARALLFTCDNEKFGR